VQNLERKNALVFKLFFNLRNEAAFKPIPEGDTVIHPFWFDRKCMGRVVY